MLNVNGKRGAVGAELGLMSDKTGSAVSKQVLGYTAILVEVEGEGEAERRGGMLVFKIAPKRLR